MIESVYAEAGADSAELAAVREVFRSAGFEVDVEPAIARRSRVEVLPWIVSVTLTAPIALWFGSFLVESGKLAAQDANAAVKALVKGILAARSGRGALDIDDPEGSHLNFSSDLPDEALDALAGIDWDEARGGYLFWDPTERRWLDPTTRLK